MSEKIFGFKEKDALQGGNIRKTSLETVYYKIQKKNLISVISLEWLEKEIKEMAQEAELHTRHLYSKEGYLLALNNLLVAIRAKVQAGEK